MILVLETSTPRASLALFDQDEIVWEADFVTRRSHNSKIFEPVKDALEIAGEQLSLIAVGVGPGSYSGVRVGISVANGLGFARGVPVVGLSSLAAFPEADCTVISDARRKTFSVGRVVNRDLTAEPELVDAEKFSSVLETIEGPVFTADEHVADAFEEITLCYPAASQLARAAAQLTADEIVNLSAKPVEPHYLRAPFITVAKKKPSFRK
jgi:tRNA threonylcarbamoyladenosine biosynthesis protein TsaB